MNPTHFSHTVTAQLPRYAMGLLVWALGWGAMWLLAARLDISNLGLLLVLTSAIAAMWLPVSMTLLASVVALMAFNWAFVPPRGTFAIDIHQHAVLLLALLVVNVIIAGLMVSLREQSRRSQQHAAAVDELRSWGDTLRDANEPQILLVELQAMLVQLSRRPVSVMALRAQLPVDNSPAAIIPLGNADQEQLEGLWHCLRQGQALGPGTGRYQELADMYLPLRGRSMTCGAVMIAGFTGDDHANQAQALCDQMGLALERHRILQQEHSAREEAQAQSLRNTLLAAISHDYRTPLATIMSAASSLDQQGERLTEAQRKQLALRILDEADRLRRLTNNILQLARLDASGITLNSDWESVEEIVGSVLHRIRTQDPQHRISARLQPDLPLLWGDALLMSQLLENLLENALKYSTGPVIVLACCETDCLSLTVSDTGPGIAPDLRDAIFIAFQRGDNRQSSQPGAGVGLALCRAIARAHGGELHLQTGASGTTFECSLPLKTQPARPDHHNEVQS